MTATASPSAKPGQEAGVNFPRQDDKYKAGQPIDIVRGAAGNDPIAKVEFYVNERKIGEVLGNGRVTGGHTFIWKKPRPGTYVLEAVATDETGASATSKPVTITVVAPEDWPTPPREPPQDEADPPPPSE